MSTNDAEEVLMRLKAFFRESSDIALCKRLAISPQTLSSWKRRDKVPYAICVDLAKANGVSLDWLLTGRGNMHLQSDDRPAREDQPLSPRMKALIDMYQTLSDKDQDEILRDAEEKKRMREMELRIQELSSKVEALKKSG